MIGALATVVALSAITGLVPVLAMKLVVRLYPRADPRRAELLAELFTVSFHDRLSWVFQCVGLGMTEGLPSRWRLWQGDLQRRRTSAFTATSSRALDVLFATVILFTILPMLLFAAIAIRLSSAGPVIAREKRIGRDGRSFHLLKFRTTYSYVQFDRAQLIRARTAEDVQPTPLRCVPRITRLGRLMRKISLDEMPQTWNVLRGDMSMVGPRPIHPAERDEWGSDIADYLSSRPGLTGMWQHAGSATNGSQDRQHLDLDLLRNWSVGRYLRLIVRTVGVVLTCPPRRDQD